MNISLFVRSACLLAALGASAAEVVKTVNPTWEVAVADDVMAPPPDAGVDAAPEIQRRLDAIGATGGGTLFLKAGTYRLASPIVMPISCPYGRFQTAARVSQQVSTLGMM